MCVCVCVCVCVEIIDCCESDCMIEICGKLDKSNSKLHPMQRLQQILHR